MAVGVCRVIVSFTQVFSIVNGCVAAFHFFCVRSNLFWGFPTRYLFQFFSYLHDAAKGFPPSEYPYFNRRALDGRGSTVQAPSRTGCHRVVLVVYRVRVVPLRNSSYPRFVFVMSVPAFRFRSSGFPVYRLLSFFSTVILWLWLCSLC